MPSILIAMLAMLFSASLDADARGRSGGGRSSAKSSYSSVKPVSVRAYTTKGGKIVRAHTRRPPSSPGRWSANPAPSIRVSAPAAIVVPLRGSTTFGATQTRAVPVRAPISPRDEQRIHAANQLRRIDCQSAATIQAFDRAKDRLPPHGNDAAVLRTCFGLEL